MTSRPTIRRRAGKTFQTNTPRRDGETPEDENDSTPEDAQDNSESGEVQDNEETGEIEETGEKETNESDTVDVGELKIVLHLREGRTSAGVWQPGADVHLETFMETDMSILVAELPGLLERAQARWNENPLRPKYEPPKKNEESFNEESSNEENSNEENSNEESAGQPERDDAGDGNPAGAGAGATAARHGTTFLTQTRKPAPSRGAVAWGGKTAGKLREGR